MESFTLESFSALLEKYAQISVHIGINLQPGQPLVVRAPIEAAEFVRALVATAYDAGAIEVFVEWEDDQITLLRYQKAPASAFQTFPEWLVAKYEQLTKEGAAFLSVLATDPDLLKDVDPERVATDQKTRHQALHTYRQAISSMRVSWLLVSVPTPAWAAKVFPELPEPARTEKLWSQIFYASRVDADDPVAAWQAHIHQLRARADGLNHSRFAALHYQGPGTDLRVQLVENHLWISAESPNDQGTLFVPNMPTEEVFSMPHRAGVEGVVTSTMPLNYNGIVIDNFSLTFQAGKVVDFSAEQGYETLKQLLDTDEGSRSLGEVALVAHDSPISNLGTLFYNTLFDENASCHLAIGDAYPVCIEGGTEMSREALLEAGANQSLTHVDFMIGSKDLNIDGITSEGQVVPLFRNGNWVS